MRCLIALLMSCSNIKGVGVTGLEVTRMMVRAVTLGPVKASAGPMATTAGSCSRLVPLVKVQ